MRTVEISAEFLVCTDCAMVLANGTDGWGTDLDGNELGELHAARMRDGDIVLAGYDIDEEMLSSVRCEACGTTDLGYRLPACEFLPAHVDYPHHAGYLFDCPACESRCHCEPGNAECVFDGTHATFPII